MTGRQSMTLEEFAALAGMNGPPPHPGGDPVVMTSALAGALNDLLQQCALESDQWAEDDPFSVALARVQALHDFTRVTLGGRPVAEGDREGAAGA